MPATSLPQLDLFTVKAVTLVTVLVVSLYTLLAWKINRPVAGMRLFSLGLLSICVGSIVGMSRLVVAETPIMILGNILTVGGMISLTRGIREFRGASRFPRSFSSRSVSWWARRFSTGCSSTRISPNVWELSRSRWQSSRWRRPS